MSDIIPNTDNPSKEYTLKCLNGIEKHLDNKVFTKDISEYFDVIRGYINNIAKWRQEKRDLELKEIYSEVVKEYLIERAKLIEKLKFFII